MKRLASLILAAITLGATVCTNGVTASANSGDSYWYGYDGGVIYMTEDCPLQVKSENLTFDITGFPYDEGVYCSRVQAEYTFYNPENYDVTARLLFPFGTEPSYYADIDDTSALDGIYGVTIDGRDANADPRYSYSPDGDFDFETYKSYLHDEKLTKGNFSEDTTVTKVTIESTESGLAVIDYTLTAGNTIILADDDAYSRQSVSGGEISSYVVSGSEISAYVVLDLNNKDYFYILGDVPDNMTAAECEWGSSGGASINLQRGDETAYNTESLGNLGDFLDRYNVLEYGAYSEVDWFNFCLYSISYTMSSYYTGFSNFLYDLEDVIPVYGLSDYAVRWYSYDLTVESGGYAENTVTAPVYPTVNKASSPYQYLYTYLLSPAATWASFENLTITVNAPYYMLESSAEFTLTGSVEDGTSVYTAVLESLPEGELTFTLCSEAEAVYSDGSDTAMIIIIVVVVVVFVLLAGAALAVIMLAVTGKLKK